MSERRILYRTMHCEPTTYQDVRLPDGSLAFRYDPQRRIVEIQVRGRKHYLDLTQLDRQAIDNLVEIR